LQDTLEASRLIKDAIHSYAIDPSTGRIDMDLVNTGKGSSWREKMRELKRQLKILIQESGKKLLDLSELHYNFRSHTSIVNLIVILGI
jgi:DNA replication licensing factor MCM4